MISWTQPWTCWARTQFTVEHYNVRLWQNKCFGWTQKCSVYHTKGFSLAKQFQFNTTMVSETQKFSVEQNKFLVWHKHYQLIIALVSWIQQLSVSNKTLVSSVFSLTKQFQLNTTTVRFNFPDDIGFNTINFVKQVTFI